MPQSRFPRVPSDDLDPRSEGDLKLGELVDGKFRIVRKLGSGTVGHVYEGVHTLIGYRAALKVLSHEMAMRPDAMMLLLHEARVANSIRHPNIVEMVDLSQSRDDRLLYLVMELLEGEDLEQYLRRSDAISRLDSLDLVLQICAGLSAAHGEGVFHRDLKPQNIFLIKSDDPVPYVKILDFGLSRVSRPGTRSLWYQGSGHLVGTPLYCSPELIQGNKNADHRADIYSLGVILYRMWTGRLPFDSPSVSEVLRMQADDPPPLPSSVSPGISEQSERILLRALEKDPNNRYQSVGELRMELELVSTIPRPIKLGKGPNETK